MERIGDDKRYTVRDRIELAVYGIFIFAVLVGGVRFVFVSGPSMTPTLSQYSIHVTVPVQKPEVGDIVVFRRPGQKDSYIKRIVAGPGDRVDHWGEMITLGDDEYYVMGDNRENSRDSRSFGPIHGNEIWGRLLF